MPVVNAFATLELGQVGIGDLIAMREHDNTLEYAIALSQADEERRLVIVLTPQGQLNEPPHFYAYDNGCDVVSFGGGWVFEPILPEVGGKVLGYHVTDLPIGSGYVGAGDVFLRVGRNPRNIQERGALISLTHFTAIRGEPFGLGLTSWRLWLSDEERRRPGGRPLISYTAAPPQPR